MEDKILLAKLKTDSTYTIGRFNVVKGYYGPAALMEIETFRTVEPSANIIYACTHREMLLLLGFVEPETQADFDFVRAKAQEWSAKVPQVKEATQAKAVAKAVVEVAVAEAKETAGAPGYHEMLAEMKGAGFDFRQWLLQEHDVEVQRPKKRDVELAYAAFKSG